MSIAQPFIVFIRRLIAALACVLASSTAVMATVAVVDVNQADQATLESVRGIGPTMSGKLLAERKKAPFKNWADLIERVSGVGPGNAAKFSAAGMTVQGKPFDSSVAVEANARPAAAKKAADATDAKKIPAATERGSR